MKKLSILTVVLGIMCALCFVGCQEAEATSEKGISDVASLKSFIANSESKGTVIADFTCSETICFDNTVDKTLDFNGHTITCGGNSGAFDIDSVGTGTVVFCDSKGGAVIKGIGQKGHLFGIYGRKVSIKDGITVNLEENRDDGLLIAAILLSNGTIDELNANVTGKRSDDETGGAGAINVEGGTINNISGGYYKGIVTSKNATAYGIDTNDYYGTVVIKKIGKVTFEAENTTGDASKEKNYISDCTASTYPLATFIPTF